MRNCRGGALKFGKSVEYFRDTSAPAKYSYSFSFHFWNTVLICIKQTF